MQRLMGAQSRQVHILIDTSPPPWRPGRNGRTCSTAVAVWHCWIWWCLGDPGTCLLWWCHAPSNSPAWVPPIQGMPHSCLHWCCHSSGCSSGEDQGPWGSNGGQHGEERDTPGSCRTSHAAKPSGFSLSRCPHASASALMPEEWDWSCGIPCNFLIASYLM